MNKEKLKASPDELAKHTKTEADLNQLTHMLIKITAQTVLNA